MGDEIVLTDENIPPMQDELFRLYSQGFLTDITLSCEDGKNFEAHRVLLAARSQYFYGIVPKLKLEPVIFLKGIKGSHLEKVLKYIYSGSANVSRSQIKSVLEVARSLQVKGLQELAPTELGRGLNTSYQSSSSPVPLKSKDNAYHSKHSPQNARDAALHQQQKIYDKISLTSKKSPLGRTSLNSQYSPSSHSKKHKSIVKEPAGKAFKEDENGEEIFKFQYQYISDDSDDMDKDDSNDSDFEVANKKAKDSAEVDTKKKKGKKDIVKGKKDFGKDDSDLEYHKHGGRSSSEDDSDNSSDLDQDDDSDSDSDSDANSGSGSDDDEEEAAVPNRISSHQSSKSSGSPRDKSQASAASLTPKSRSGRGPSVNGKQILPVQCKGKRAELYLSRFGNGTNGKSIKYKGEWMTPEDYELNCGIKAKKYLESITTDYGPLKTLTVSGLLKPHPKKCKCGVCLNEEFTSPEQMKNRSDDRANRPKPEYSHKGEPAKVPVKKRDGSPLVAASDTESKKRKHETTDSEHKHKSSHLGSQHQSSRQLTSKSSRDKSLKSSEAAHKLQTTNTPSKLSPSITKSDIISPATLSTTKTNPSTLSSAPSVSTSSTFSSSLSKPLASPSFIAMTPPASLSSLTPLQTSSTTALTALTSPSPFNSNKFNISPASSSGSTQSSQPLSTSSTVSPVTASYLQSPGQPATSLASLQSPVSGGKQPSAAPVSLASSSKPATSGMGPPASKPAEPLQMLGSMQQSPVAGMGQQATHVSPHQQLSKAGQHGHNSTTAGSGAQATGRIGSVMQVRCKSLSALLYVSKYESGSKGKCILVNDEWMTPNEFEEKAGSKAKKYLSSIKCLGRPLRAYVNSGELRGTGPLPSPKPPKINKPVPPKPIAPAPGPGQSHGYGSMAAGGHMSPAGHMSAASSMQWAAAGAVQSQPILLNQSSLAAVSIASGQSSINTAVATPILQPMAFTFAPMQMQGQQLQHQPLQHQQLHGTTVTQQLHASTDYILQQK